MISILVFLTLQSFAQTIEPVDPITLCERFVTSPEKKDCVAKIKKIQPDSYLAAVCDQQFDTDQFYKCVETTATMQFDPKELFNCSKPMLDDERMNCLSAVGKNLAKKDSSRMPAGKKPKKK